MSQYSTGLSSVTNGSPTVTGTSTLWLANVTAGDSFTVAGDGVMYDVASVDSDTQVTLSVAYAGVTASGVVYAIGTGFTVPDSFPEMSQGDIETATIFTRAMRKIQSRFTGIAINTTAEIVQAVSDHEATNDHPLATTIAKGFLSAVDKTKLDTVESGATADQTDAEIKIAYESNANTNEFSDAEQTKLLGIEDGATADQTKADIDALNIDADTLDGIDSLGFDAAGAADTAVSDHVALPDPHSQYAELSGAASANFTLMPQVGGDPIVESGSNADGEWTRWSDGTQICKTESPLNQTAKYGRFEMNYPTPFSNATSNFRVVAGSENQGSTFARRYNVNSVSVGSTSILMAYLGVSSIAYPVRYMIIGRWK